MVLPWVRDELRNFYLRPRSLLIHHRDPASRDRSRTLEPEEPTDRLSLIFAALADPTRREILSRLAQGPATVGEVAEPFDMSAPAISQHLKVLERAGLVTRTVKAQWRTLSLEAQPLGDAAAWVEEQRRDWNLRLDALEHHLEAMTARTNDDVQE